VKESCAKILRKQRPRIARGLREQNRSDQPKPMLEGGNLHYEVAERAGAVSCGGQGAIPRSPNGGIW